ncbi:hypothetical protein B0H34DRAFT_795528 [Crassisporium funariophilum]|nr:hypothetical protein B0H34DRAFT_795528 [Crassisporium funariophilum]
MSDKNSALVFVTGASGFLATHIISQLLEKGYRVRGTARGKKVDALRLLYKSSPSVEIVEIADIAHDAFPEALEGVYAVIHTASPLPGRADPETMLNSAIQGSLNVLRQAEKAGVEKFVVTSSTATVFGDPSLKGVTLRAEHWNPMTKEQALSGGSPAAYAAAKKFAELAVWEWAEAHPHVDVTTIIPPFLYGPAAPMSLPIPTPDFNAISTNLMIYNLITPTGVFPPRPAYVDFRDAARAHVGALQSRPSLPKERKRVLFASPYGFVFKDALGMIARGRPEVKDRLIQAPAPEFSFDRYDIDFERVEEITGVKKGDFHTLEETLLGVIDDILKLEKEWKRNGRAVEHVPVMDI